MTRIVACLVLLLAASCGPRPTDTIDTSEGPKEEDVSLKVVSHHFGNVVVYLYRGESRQRLGLATGKSVSDFKIPWRVVSGNRSVRLFGEAIGAGPLRKRNRTQEQYEDLRDHGQSDGEVTSDRLQLNPGSQIVWTLQERLDQSIVMVY